jgi:hypothetical protein
MEVEKEKGYVNDKRVPHVMKRRNKDSNLRVMSWIHYLKANQKKRKRKPLKFQVRALII